MNSSSGSSVKRDALLLGRGIGAIPDGFSASGHTLLKEKAYVAGKKKEGEWIEKVRIFDNQIDQKW